MFLKNRTINEFRWENLGDVKAGREDLGEEMPVVVYRLMQFTMLDVLTKEFGSDKANEFFTKAGFLAGSEFAKNVLDLTVDFNTFLSNLTQALVDLKIGVLRMEAFEVESGKLVLTVGQDLDCSGLPVTNETVCHYDEGFIAGILHAYTGKPYSVKEVDCWASGDRVCRFNAEVAS
ncbi:MAG: 4-vinyl reductase [Clostridiales Family XIII bacterium]|nr:4-vinyl reductase [Clostridiales Family XIII bacterium]